MKARTIILGMLCNCLILGCTNKQERRNTIIGGADGTAEIVIAEKSGKQDRDTVTYEIPQCRLWYTEELPEAGNDKEIRMRTERESYWEDVQVIDVFVTNPTDIPINFGRRWHIYVWNGEEWVYPELKVSHLMWEDDLFVQHRGMLLYCFRFPVGEYYHLPKGKYRLVKTFWANKKEITLVADFDIYSPEVVPVKSLGTNGGGRVESK